MNTTQNIFNQQNRSNQTTQNPWGQAFGDVKPELEQNLSGSNNGSGFDDLAELSKAMAQSGGSFDGLNQDTSDQNQLSPQDQQKWMEEQRIKAQQEQAKLKRHQEINSIDKQQELFARRKRDTQQQVEKIRQEIQMEIKAVRREAKALAQEIDVTTFNAYVDPGEDGKYHLTFLQQIKRFLMLLRKRIKSARTWATQVNSKKKKKKSKKPGLEIGASKNEKTSTVHDMLENSESNIANMGA